MPPVPLPLEHAQPISLPRTEEDSQSQRPSARNVPNRAEAGNRAISRDHLCGIFIFWPGHEGRKLQPSLHAIGLNMSKAADVGKTGSQNYSSSTTCNQFQKGVVPGSLSPSRCALSEPFRTLRPSLTRLLWQRNDLGSSTSGSVHSCDYAASQSVDPALDQVSRRVALACALQNTARDYARMLPNSISKDVPRWVVGF